MASGGHRPGDPPYGLPPNYVPPEVVVEDVIEDDNIDGNNNNNGGHNGIDMAHDGGNGVINPPRDREINPRHPINGFQQYPQQFGIQQ